MNLLTNILSWVLFGSVIGGLAYLIEPGLRNIKPFLYGIIGAAITGIVTNIILQIPIEQFSLISFMVAICGASFFVIWSGMLRNI